MKRLLEYGETEGSANVAEMLRRGVSGEPGPYGNTLEDLLAQSYMELRDEVARVDILHEGTPKVPGSRSGGQSQVSREGTFRFWLG